MSNSKPFRTPADFKGNHLVSINQFDRSSAEYLMSVADIMKNIVTKQGGCDLLKHRVLSNLFYEPSTRTSSSFAAAMQRLGGSVIQINESTSSVVKGETLSDTIKCLCCYSDAVVIRHPVKGSAAEASAACPVPVLNGGDGVGEHPSQALLDVYTIMGELGRLDNLSVVLVGDLKNGRTVHSLSRLLSLWPGVKLTYVAPPELAMPDYITEELGQRGVAQGTSAALDEATVAQADVIYVTRVQKERFSDPAEYERLKHAYVVTAETLKPAKAKMAVMHPLPRVGEIAVEVDSDPRAAYFRQMRYGLYLRMALLALVLGASKEQAQAALGQ